LHDQVLPIFKIAMTHKDAERVRLDPAESVFDDLPGVTFSNTRLEIQGSSRLELIAKLLALAETVSEAHPDPGDGMRSILSKIGALLQKELSKSSNEERCAFWKHWRTLLAARGATQMYIAVDEIAKALMPITPHLGEKWSEIESSPHPNVAKVRVAISKWAERYNLADPWILETVVQTLFSWMANPEYEEELRWAHAGYLSPIPQDPPRFQVEPPRPFESRKAFLHRANEELKAFYSSEYFLDVGRDHKYAFEWLAQFQTKLDSPGKIAIELERETGERRTPSAIILAIHTAAEEIGLTLRRTLRGPSAKKRS
jgi:hypothetical protein